MNKVNNVLLILLLLYGDILSARQLESIYSTTIELGERYVTSIEQQQIIQQEFSKILLKLTGDSQVNIPRLPEQYLGRYQYNKINEIPEKILLTIDFQKKIIEHELTVNRQLFLTEDRPVTIVWPKTSNPILDNVVQELFEKIKIISKEYALPIVYPILDLQEVAMLTTDITDLRLTKMLQISSEKYHADEIVIASCKTNGVGELLIHFMTINDDANFNKHIIENHDNQTDSKIEKIARNFVVSLMRYLIVKNSKEIAPDPTSIAIKVLNINHMEEYVKVENYLQNLSIIKQVNATNFANKSVEFKVVAIGGKAAIKKILSGNNMLQESSPEAAHIESSEQLIYALN